MADRLRVEVPDLEICWRIENLHLQSARDDNLFKILNGRDAKEGEFPYQVQILYRDNFICGGSIIDELHIITAVHCLLPYRDDIEKYSVLAGVLHNHDIQNRHRVHLHFEKIYPEGNFPPTDVTAFGDIAIARLKNGFKKFTDFVQPVPLNTEASKEVMCNVTGWGDTKPLQSGNQCKDAKPITLQVVEIPIMSEKKCSDLGSTVDPSVLCAGYAEGGKGACWGDDGGPLVCEGKLFGIVLYAFTCNQAQRPGIYADVAFYRNWINETLGESHKEVHQCPKRYPGKKKNTSRKGAVRKQT